MEKREQREERKRGCKQKQAGKDTPTSMESVCLRHKQHSTPQLHRQSSMSLLLPFALISNLAVPLASLFLSTTSAPLRILTHPRHNLSFPRLRDDPFLPEMYGTSNKAVLLKTKLLDNLNNYFDTSQNDRLEIFHAPAQQDSQNGRADDQSGWQANSIQQEENPFPTLLTSPAPILSATQRRIESRITDADELRSIREWRKRLYRAFKSNSHSHSQASNKPSTIIRFIGDGSPIETKPIPDGNGIMDGADEEMMQGGSHRSRKEQSWQSMLAAKRIKTFGRDRNGNIVPLVGTERSGYNYETDAVQQPIESEIEIEIERGETRKHIFRPYPPQAHRTPYRTSDQQPVVFVPSPASNQDENPYDSPSNQNQPIYKTYPSLPPATAFLVTATAHPPSPPSYIPTLPPLVTPSSYTQFPFNPMQEYGAARALPFHSFPSYPSAPQPPYIQQSAGSYAAPNYAPSQNLGPTPPPQHQTLPTPPTIACMRNPNCIENVISDEKCNSMRLRTIIQNNIIPNDAESSKRAVQEAAEAETGLYFDCICGTGFFSYIAHTDEYCLASAGSVNCYLFAPLCSNAPEIFGKSRKSKKARRKVFLNKN
ncbi:hypothetical protein WR25_19245 [Diploscapter pachys]|uniref:Ground-like domain-containing protein n=1 Tax=Diploscapter pachys TaxID=2018661 RepID=A0A2A2LYD8_9BILA|nr:hypothetical protein WR25_19245 [Diploscapter pachys]